jgi:riboflavin synthase
VFTGLVEEKGALAARRRTGEGAVLRLRTSLGPLVLGESISVDGACLTVSKVATDGFDADVSAETLARTTLGELREGAPVNLERSLALGDRLGGHLVSGHVDATCTLARRAPVGDAITMTFEFPRPLARFIAEKGSVAVNGVSLTVNAVSADTFDVTIIPHTRDATSLGALAVGGKANLEVDLIARYLARLVSTSPAGDPIGKDAAWLERLERSGFA